jgi:DNA-binding IclR family transcriptional regulator
VPPWGHGSHLRLGPALSRLAVSTIAEAEGRGQALALVVVEPSWTDFHVAYRIGSRHPLRQGAAGRAILAGRTGSSAVVQTAGELQSGAHGLAAPVQGVPGLEASVGVVALQSFASPQVAEAVTDAAQALALGLTGPLPAP